MLEAVLLIPFILLCFFVSVMVKISFFDKSHKGSLGEKIIILLFALALVGAILRSIQLSYDCYNKYGTINCGGNAPDENSDYLFPQPK